VRCALRQRAVSTRGQGGLIPDFSASGAGSCCRAPSCAPRLVVQRDITCALNSAPARLHAVWPWRKEQADTRVHPGIRRRHATVAVASVQMLAGDKARLGQCCVAWARVSCRSACDLGCSGASPSEARDRRQGAKSRSRDGLGHDGRPARLRLR